MKRAALIVLTFCGALVILYYTKYPRVIGRECHGDDNVYSDNIICHEVRVGDPPCDHDRQ
jgi:hypothetical protein